MRGTATLLAVLALSSVSFGQNLLENPSFQDPAFARVELIGNVADGWTVTLDSDGVAGGPRVFEFDTDGSVTAGNIAVDVSGGVDTDNAADRLKDAISADGVLPLDVSERDINDGDPDTDPQIRLTWQGVGGDGLVNNTTQPTEAWIHFFAGSLADGDQVVIEPTPIAASVPARSSWTSPAVPIPPTPRPSF